MVNNKLGNKSIISLLLKKFLLDWLECWMVLPLVCGCIRCVAAVRHCGKADIAHSLWLVNSPHTVLHFNWVPEVLPDFGFAGHTLSLNFYLLFLSFLRQSSSQTRCHWLGRHDQWWWWFVPWQLIGGEWACPVDWQDVAAHSSIRLVTQLFASDTTLLLGTHKLEIAVC